MLNEKSRDRPKGGSEADAAEAAVRGLDLGVPEFKQMLEKSAKQTVALAREPQSVAPLKLSPKQFLVDDTREGGGKTGGGALKGKAKAKGRRRARPSGSSSMWGGGLE